jgi:prephenate dehydrogenase
MEEEIPFKRLTVIGLGLIGGSIAMAARERFPELHIQGIDPKAETLQYALKHKVIDQAALTLPTQFEADQLIVIACHLSPSLSILQELAACVNAPNILITDIGSCKAEITAMGQTLLPTQFIAGHPMAGKEFSGIEHATPLLFAGKPYLLCPHSATAPQQLQMLQDFVKQIGGLPKLIDAEKHDRYMAYVSHLPQLYSILLTNVLYRNEPGHLMAYHGAGLDDQLRLAASPHSMWGDVLLHNSDNLIQALSELRDVIDEAIPLLNQSGALEPWFTRANDIHRQFQNMRANR